MNWTLREKTNDEIQNAVDESRIYSRMVGGLGDTKNDICPLEVTKSNGDVKDVWSLTEKEVYGLIAQMSSTFESGNRDKQREIWAGKIIQCWGAKNPQISPKMTAELIKLRDNAKTPVSREVVRDFMGPLANKSIEDATAIAKYLNGMNGNMQAPTDAQILQVLENMASMQEMSQSKN